MRIIDKNKDFYDFYQDVYKDETFTFDRRDSFLLTKELMCEHLDWFPRNKSILSEYPHNYLLLQICYNYWLFLIEITETNNYGKVVNYKIKTLANWVNTNKSRKLYSLEVIDFYYKYYPKKKQIEDFIRDIDTNNYKIKRKINKFTLYNGNKKIEKHIPLLKACGLADCIDALEIYLAFEEYFSLEKSSSERREPLNTTDIDKIERHGFDKKVSFRGKQNGNKKRRKA